ncbi:hypothetical protein BDV25DRAFT_168906 [Aspergillus avenaceus]|uniref:Zn(2)-C6 fungal-type domain-containing protein n=1 Tax=Aspergillus avenaceus TaxID=36643 RepID=A0A5N6U4K9_ASPAV|nr:hypothetical protein BDV25DRAFT_168906 [Aspergillus avenaceus]
MSPDHRPLKRRRPAKSCEQCRQRKVRCDQNIPCGPCTRARTELRCSYRGTAASPQTPLPTPDLYGPIHDVVPHPAPNHHTPTSLGDVEPRKTMERLPPADSLLPPISPVQLEPSVRDVQRRLQSLEDRLSRCESNNASEAHYTGLAQPLHDLTEKVQAIEHQLSRSSALADPREDEGLSVSSIPPRLHVSGNKMKLQGPTHWIHRVDKLQVIQSFNTKEPEPSFKELKGDLASLIKECRRFRQAIKSQQSVRFSEPIADLYSTIPPRSVCDKFVNYYLQTFEMIYRVVHVPSFWKEYDKFWEQPQFAAASFLMKLVLILTIGAVFYSGRENLLNDQYTHLAQTWIYAAHWWLTGPTEKTTMNLDGMQVFCLLLLARKVGPLGSSPWLSTGSLAQIAMTIGLHQDPAQFPTLSFFQSEMRVRLWATVLELILQSSLESAAVPPPLSDDFVTRAPLNIDDQDISPNSSTTPIPKPSSIFTNTSIQILLYESSRLRLSAIQSITNRNQQTYQQVLQLGSKLQDICRRFAKFFHSMATRDYTHDSGPTSFHRKYLDIELRRYILALHMPFMMQARKDPQYYYSRKVCLESAMVIASYADDLNLPSNELDYLSRLTIVGRGSFKGPLGLDIISVLGLEIVTQLEEDASERQQSVNPKPGPLEELAKASRAPLVHSLEHILGQLLQIIALGSPSTKRYNFLAAILGQIRAMESGQCIKRVIYESVKQSLKECYSLMQDHAERAPRGSMPDPSAASVPHLADPTLSSLDMLDPGFDFDLQSLLCPTGMDGTSSAGF